MGVYHVRDTQKTTDRTKPNGTHNEAQASMPDHFGESIRSTSGATSSWLVDFERLEPNRTRVVLHRSYDPEDAVGNTGDSTDASSSRLPFHDVASARIEADLQRFKEFIES